MAARTAGARARLAGRRPLGRAQLGAVVGARRRAGHRPRRAAARSSYDEATGIVTASPAIKGGAELAPYLEARGRFFLGGHCPTVGIGGFLLQGGQGWNARGWGWAAEYVVAVDVVTADGELVRADAEQNADLYWAARGAGPGLLRRRDPVPPAHAARCPRHVAQTVQAYRPRRLRRGDDLAARDPRTRSPTPSRSSRSPRPTRRSSPEPVLLVTGVALVDDAGRGGRGPRAVPRLPRARPGAAGARRRADHARRAAQAPARGQPRGPPLGGRQRLARPARAAEVVPAMRRAYTTLPNDKAFTIWFSMAPLRELPDMAFSLQSEIYLARTSLWEDAGGRRALPAPGCATAMADLEPVTVGPVPRRQRPLAAARCGSCPTRTGRGCSEIRADARPRRAVRRLPRRPDGATNRNHWRVSRPHVSVRSASSSRHLVEPGEQPPVGRVGEPVRREPVALGEHDLAERRLDMTSGPPRRCASGPAARARPRPGRCPR